MTNVQSVPGGNTMGENNENQPDNDQSQQVDMLGSTRQVVSLASLKRKFSADLHSCSTTGQASKRPTIIQPKVKEINKTIHRCESPLYKISLTAFLFHSQTLARPVSLVIPAAWVYNTMSFGLYRVGIRNE